MQVIDHQPQAWILFRSKADLLSDVNCSHGAAGYSVLIPLSPEKAANYDHFGLEYLNRIAQSVQNYRPASNLQDRDVLAKFAEVYDSAVAKWLAQ